MPIVSRNYMDTAMGNSTGRLLPRRKPTSTKVLLLGLDGAGKVRFCIILKFIN